MGDTPLMGYSLIDKLMSVETLVILVDLTRTIQMYKCYVASKTERKLTMLSKLFVIATDILVVIIVSGYL